MHLTKVTFTGADDSTDQAEMLRISREWPQVEWGILFSGNRYGTPRYPSKEWVSRLSENPAMRNVQLSAHLCGRWVRDLVLDGRLSWWFDHPATIFDRYQLNFHGQFHKANRVFSDAMNGLQETYRSQFIFQCDGVNDDAVRGYVTKQNLGVPLFDVSGGAGIVPESWPPIWRNKYCGYAGGLGPDNIEGEIERIALAANDAPFWIDMETKVRSEDDRVFDLDKCVAVLEKLKPVLS